MTDNADCIVWPGALNSSGYGDVWANGKNKGVHRVVWEAANGPIPSGLQIDHLCRNRACIKVAHLEPVTQKENILRGESFAAINAKKIHCHAGHPLDATNTYLMPGNRRVCRECRAARAALGGGK